MTLGIMFRCQFAPEALPEMARCSEAAGFDELWVVEDCFFNGGVSAAAVALAVTKSITVGLGIMPAVARNAAFVAMEIATLARIYPGRFHAGFGHGVADWMRQVGAFPSSQVGAIEEVASTVYALLHGARVTHDGTQVRLREVELIHKPDPAPLLSLGVRGVKSLAISGRTVDGTIIPEGSGPTYVRWVREQVDRAAAQAGRTAHHRLTVYTLCSIDADRQQARARVRPALASFIASGDLTAQLTPPGFASQAQALVERGGREALIADMPDAWLDELVVAGNADDGRAAVQRLREAGADTVVLVPLLDQPGDSVDALRPLIGPSTR